MAGSTASESAYTTEPSAYLFPTAFTGSGSAPTASTTRSSVSLWRGPLFEELAGVPAFMQPCPARERLSETGCRDSATPKRRRKTADADVVVKGQLGNEMAGALDLQAVVGYLVEHDQDVDIGF